jgi:hypothetical protein
MWANKKFWAFFLMHQDSLKPFEPYFQYLKNCLPLLASTSFSAYKMGSWFLQLIGINLYVALNSWFVNNLKNLYPNTPQTQGLSPKKSLEAKKLLEVRGIDPRTSRMLSERSTIWATPPWMMAYDYP